MGSTNYVATFIQVADDCTVAAATAPPVSGKALTMTRLQYELISAHPYELTSDDVLFQVYAIRHGIAADEQTEARIAFFAREQPCLRSSALGKRYGWGIHHDDGGRVALVPVESDRYRALTADPALGKRKAMRSKRK